MNPQRCLGTLVIALVLADAAWAQREVVVLAPPTVDERPVLVQAPPPPPVLVPEERWVEIVPAFRADFGVRTWISTGQSSLSVAGANGTPPTLSHLRWSRLNNTIFEVTADLVWRDRWILDIDLGAGTSGGGTLRDRDFNDDGSLSSDTAHRLRNDQLFYFSFDLGYRFAAIEFDRRPGRFTFDGLIGFQHWEERYRAFDGVDLYPGTRVFTPGLTATNRFLWDSLRLGARAKLEYPRWSVEGRIYVIPFTSFEDTDIHHRRDDVRHDPSFIDRADGGGGVQGDLTFRYRLTPYMNLEAGYRWWSLRSGDGYTITRTDDADFISPFNGARTFRHGLTLGLSFWF